MGAILGHVTKVVFSTHYYEFNGTIYHQVKGGPTGLRPTGPGSRILLDYWRCEVKQIEELSQALNTLNPINFEKLNVYLLKICG